MISGVGTDANPKLMVFSSFQSLERPENSPLLVGRFFVDFVVAVTATTPPPPPWSRSIKNFAAPGLGDRSFHVVVENFSA